MKFILRIRLSTLPWIEALLKVFYNTEIASVSY